MARPSRRWSVESLERALRGALLQRTSVKLGALPISHSAEAQWVEPNGRVKARVDAHQTGIRTAVVHELVHVVLHDFLESFDEDLAEVLVVALEARLDARISLSTRRDAWWRKAIQSVRRP